MTKGICGLLTTAALAVSSYAGDYYFSDPDYTKDVDGHSLTGAFWAPVGGNGESVLISPSASTANDNFWIISDYSAGGHAATQANWRRNQSDVSNKGIFNLGSPADHPDFPGVSGRLQHRQYANCYAIFSRLNWYNGVIYNGQSQWSSVRGKLYLFDAPNAVHEIRQNDNNRQLRLDAELVSESTDVDVSIYNDNTLALTHTAYVGLLHDSSGSDNSGYKGTFSLKTAYLRFYFGKTHPLGDPNVPNPAALKVCENGVFGLHTTTTQSPNRGIRLEGATAYYNAIADGLTLSYPISKADGVAGKLVKYDTFTDRFDGAYTAGDLVVQHGVLILDWNFSAPTGTHIKVCDGAELVSYVDLDRYSVTTEGSGKYGYAEGIRYVNGVLECKVTVLVSGNGTVSTRESWGGPLSPVKMSATALTDEFLNWSGDLRVLKKGESPFSSSVTLAPTSPGTITANFGVPTNPEDKILADGTTLTFRDRELTINVPSGVSSGDDYSSAVLSGIVTNIVKTGAGTFCPPSMANYMGDFDIREGGWVTSDVAEFGVPGIGVLRFSSGTVNYIDTVSAVAPMKKVYCGGSFEARVAKANTAGYLAGCDVVFTDQVTLKQTGEVMSLFKGSNVDLAGHTLKFVSTATWKEFVLAGVAFTNSAATPVTLTIPSGYHRLALDEGTSFRGGAQNVLKFDFDTQLALRGRVDADWTLQLNSLYRMNGVGSSVNTTNCQWTGTVSVDYYNDLYPDRYLNSSVNDSCLTFGGPVSGDKMLRIHGGALNFTGRGSTYSGQIWMSNSKVASLHPLIKVWDGAEFSHSTTSPVLLDSTDFEIGTETFYALPSIRLRSGSGAFRGGASAEKACGRSTIQSYTASGTQLTFDSPAVVTGTMAIDSGTLSLSPTIKASDELPVFSNLVFATGTSFDMQKNDLTVPNMTGLPTILNAGALTIGKTLVLPYEEIAQGRKLSMGEGSLIFSDGATVGLDGFTKLDVAQLVLTSGAKLTVAPASASPRYYFACVDGELVVRKKGLVLLVW